MSRRQAIREFWRYTPYHSIIMFHKDPEDYTRLLFSYNKNVPRGLGVNFYFPLNIGEFKIIYTDSYIL